MVKQFYFLGFLCLWTNKDNSWSQKFTYGHKGEIFAISSSKDLKNLFSGGAD
jgi:hypothetical protein